MKATYLNATDIMSSLELDDNQIETFLNQHFTYGDSATDLTLISRFSFMAKLKDYVSKLENKQDYMEWWGDFKITLDGITHINIEG